jgi:hypothetical protein
MAKRTSELQREACYRQHLAGETYAAIAQQMGLSREWVRYWCRRQRDGGDAQTRYRREPTGLLSRFDPKVRYVILRLRLQHPRWGPGRIVVHLKKRPSLQGKRLPKEAQVGRYLHQWPRFCRKRQARCARERLDQPIRVHQRWQFDFKMGIALGDGSQVNLHTVWEPVGEACLEAVIGYAGRVGQAFKKVTAAEAQTTLRRCFAHWHTLPEQVQTDNETTFVGQPQGDFPSRFTMWLTMQRWSGVIGPSTTMPLSATNRRPRLSCRTSWTNRSTNSPVNCPLGRRAVPDVPHLRPTPTCSSPHARFDLSGNWPCLICDECMLIWPPSPGNAPLAKRVRSS